MSKARPWFKCWESWWASRSHDVLDGYALAVGLRCLSVAQASESEADGVRWVLGGDGAPKSLDALTRETRFPRSRVKSALDQLVAVGTLVRRSDGAYGFPNFDVYQESRQAKWKRENAVNRSSTSASKVDSQVDASGVQRTEDRGQRTELTTHTVRPDPPKRAKVAACDTEPDELVATVLAEMRRAVQELSPKLHGPKDTAVNRKLIRQPVRECKATADDWIRVIRSQLESVRHDPSKWHFLSLATLGRPVNFQRKLDAPPSGKQPQSIRTGSVRVERGRHYETGELPIDD